jgi:hypothetical protein
MAKKKKKIKTPVMKKRHVEIPSIKFSWRNYLFLFLGIFLVALGYFFLSKESLTLAPILLVLGYCVLIPIGILIK